MKFNTKYLIDEMKVQHMLRSLKQDVVELCRHGSRLVHTPGHEIARSYLLKRMQALNMTPYHGESFELPYTVKGEDYVNLAGVIHGQDTSLPPLLLAAHYDTCGHQPGADDNAAAVAILLDLAAKISSGQLMRDVLILFPDAEEPPRFLTEHMGSSNFYLHQKKGPLHAGIVLDLVGHDVPVEDMEDLLFVFGLESHPKLADVIEEVRIPPGLRNIATLNRYVGDLSDYHILRVNNDPYLFLSCGRWEHYHEVSDTPEKLNYSKMSRISEFLIELVKSIDDVDLFPVAYSWDSLDVELFTFRRALGPYLKRMELPMENRDDIQRLVSHWLGKFKL